MKGLPRGLPIVARWANRTREKNLRMHPKGPQRQHHRWRCTSVRRESGPEQRYDLAANDRSVYTVGIRRVVLARGELDKLEGPKYAARRAELRREAREAARARDRQTAAAFQNEAEESD